MICVDEEVDAEEVTAEAVKSPDDVSSLEFHGGPVKFVCCATDENKQMYGTIALFLFKGGAKTVCVGIAMEAKGLDLSATASQSEITRTGDVANSI